MAFRITTGTDVPADQQSVLPGIPGVPWWGAVLIAAVCTAIGATADALLNNSLGLIYNICFLVGCVLAALAVRRRALFTAAVQPPLITAVIGLISLWSLAAANNDSTKPQGMRSAVLKVALPFANLFPWILGVFLGTLVIVLARWFFTRAAVAAAGTPGKTRKDKSAKGTSAKRTNAERKNGTTAAQSKTAQGTTAPGKATQGKATQGKGGGERPARKDDARAPKKSRRPADRPAPEDTRRSPIADETAAGGKAPKTPRRRPRRPAADTAAAQPAAATESRPVANRATPERTPRTRQDTPRPESARPAASPTRDRVPADYPAAPAVRKAPTAASRSQDRPVRRAQPQVIPPADRSRRTAGQRLRDQGAIEDLTLGIDD